MASGGNDIAQEHEHSYWIKKGKKKRGDRLQLIYFGHSFGGYGLSPIDPTKASPQVAKCTHRDEREKEKRNRGKERERERCLDQRLA